jgi:hypothetical protein
MPETPQGFRYSINRYDRVTWLVSNGSRLDSHYIGRVRNIGARTYQATTPIARELGIYPKQGAAVDALIQSHQLRQIEQAGTLASRLVGLLRDDG